MTTEPAPTTADEAPENQRVSKAQASAEALTMLRATRHAVLGTLSKRADAAPFGSVAPYALSARGEPLIYVASIAEHTRNLKADPRISLLVHGEVAGEEDIQTKGRLCLMGKASLVPKDELDDGWARYRERVPAAQTYRQTHGFDLWKIEVERVRWIGGFGEIFWLDAADFVLAPESDPLQPSHERVVSHMNEDHLDAIQDFYEAYAGGRPEAPRMVGVDQLGMDFEAPELGRLRVSFPAPTSPDGVRADVVAALRQARTRLPAR